MRTVTLWMQGKDRWSCWIEPLFTGRDRVHQQICCDCALVHDVQFSMQDGKAIYRVRRNDQLTRRERLKRSVRKAIAGLVSL